MVDGVNLFGYVRGNPMRLVDPDGREGEEYLDTWIDNFYPSEIGGVFDTNILGTYEPADENIMNRSRITLPTGGMDRLRGLVKDTEYTQSGYVERVGPDGTRRFETEMTVNMERSAVMTVDEFYPIPKDIHFQAFKRGHGYFEDAMEAIKTNAPGEDWLIKLAFGSKEEAPSDFLTIHTHTKGSPPSEKDMKLAAGNDGPSGVAMYHDSPRGGYLEAYLMVPTENSGDLQGDVTRAYQEVMDRAPSHEENPEGRRNYRDRAVRAAAEAGEIELYHYSEAIDLGGRGIFRRLR